MKKSDIKETFWESKRYYEIAHKGSNDLGHPSMALLKKYSKGCLKILDLGCGEGSRLNILKNKNNICTGIDISKIAIQTAKFQYPKCRFINTDLEKLPFKDGEFDFIYSSFTLEHLLDPEKVINEAIRVLKDNGILFFVAPNFGSPNRASPSAKYSRIRKITTGVIGDINNIFNTTKHINWTKVEPKDINGIDEYKIDYDTTIEPYLGSLRKYLLNKNFEILFQSSLWSEEKSGVFSIQRIFKLFGDLDMFPFYLWGPHMLIIGKKSV